MERRECGEEERLWGKSQREAWKGVHPGKYITKRNGVYEKFAFHVKGLTPWNLSDFQGPPVACVCSRVTIPVHTNLHNLILSLSLYHISIYLSISLSLSLPLYHISIYLSIVLCLSLSLSPSLSVCLSLYLFIYLPYINLSLSADLSLCIYLYLFIHLFICLSVSTYICLT